MVYVPPEQALRLEPVLCATTVASRNDGRFELYGLPKPTWPQFEEKNQGTLVHLGQPSGVARGSVLDSADLCVPCVLINEFCGPTDIDAAKLSELGGHMVIFRWGGVQRKDTIDFF